MKSIFDRAGWSFQAAVAILVISGAAAMLCINLRESDKAEAMEADAMFRGAGMLAAIDSMGAHIARIENGGGDAMAGEFVEAQSARILDGALLASSEALAEGVIEDAGSRYLRESATYFERYLRLSAEGDENGATGALEMGDRLALKAAVSKLGVRCDAMSILRAVERLGDGG